MDLHSFQEDGLGKPVGRCTRCRNSMILCGNVLALLHHIIQDCLDPSGRVTDPLLSQETALVSSYFFQQESPPSSFPFFLWDQPTTRTSATSTIFLF